MVHFQSGLREQVCFACLRQIHIAFLEKKHTGQHLRDARVAGRVEPGNPNLRNAEQRRAGVRPAALRALRVQRERRRVRRGRAEALRSAAICRFYTRSFAARNCRMRFHPICTAMYRPTLDFFERIIPNY